jgi:AAHS family 4-hydroxybenzoate transporter-like MFS transporter
MLSIVMAFLTPESPRFLTRQPKRALELTKLLARLGHSVPPNVTFVENVVDRPGTSILWNDFFAAGQARNTLSLWLSFFAGAANVYMCLSWLPSLLAAGGFSLALASQGLAVYNYGGVLGVVCFVILVNRFGSRFLTLASAFCAVCTALILVLVVVKPGGNPTPLLIALAAQGFFVNAVQSSFFALSVYLYPTRVRATGVAAASAVGRLGGIMSALVGPFVVQSGQQAYFKYLALAMVCAFVGLSLLRNHIPRMQPKLIRA